MSGSPRLTLEELDERGLLDELVVVFRDPGEAMELLFKVRYPPDQVPAFSNSRAFWMAVCNRIVSGLTKGGLEVLLRLAADKYQYNEKFAPWREGAAPTASPQPTQAVTAPPHAGVAAAHWGSSHATAQDPSGFELVDRPPLGPGARRASSSIKLVAEVSWGGVFEIADAPVARLVGEIRQAMLADWPAGEPRRVRVLHVLRSDGFAPLRLEATLAESGLRDDSRLRLSRLADEKDQPDDLGPLLADVLSEFYSGRDGQLQADAQRVGVARVPEGGGVTPAQSLVRVGAERDVLPDLAVLAAAADLASTTMTPALKGLAWYGSPAEVAPLAWVYLRREQRQELENLWPQLNPGD